MPVSIAKIADASSLVSLINSAYRGEESKKGWTTEADIIAGEVRILQPALEELMQKPGVAFLKAISEDQQITGCVFLEKRGEQLYLGMLSVRPTLQARGTGKELMHAAEVYASQQECKSIYMRVINLRTELITWYKRRGYYDTGQIEQYSPPAYETVVTPFHFHILQKDL